MSSTLHGEVLAESRREFDSIMQQSMNNVGDQLYTDGSMIGIFIGRPSYWMDVQSNPEVAQAYEELLDIWDVLVEDTGRFSSSGLLVANCIEVDASNETIESYIATKHNLTYDKAFNLTSRAMWDILMIRGLPVVPERS